MRTNGASWARGAAAVAVLGATALARPAAAQDIAGAEALYNSGVAEMEAGRYEKGCKALAESQRIDPRPGVLFTLATCEDRWGHLATAVTRYGDYLTLFDRLPDDRKKQQQTRPALARAQREKLLPDVPELTVTLGPGAPAGTVVTRDGQVLADAALGLSLPVDPGEHVLTTQAPGGALREQRVTIGRREKKQLTLEVTAVPARQEAAPPGAVPIQTAPPARQAQPAPQGQRVAGLVMGGVGVGGLIAGGVLGGLAVAKKSGINQHCGAAVGAKDPTACDQTGLDAANGTKGLALGSTAGLIAGGVLTAAGAIVVLTAPRSGKPSTGAQRRWISAGLLLDAGPRGMLAGARGSW